MADTPRQRFVKAMQQFKQAHEDWFGHEDLSAAFRQAIEAFADAWHGYEGGQDGAEPKAYPDELVDLLRDCGLEE